MAKKHGSNDKAWYQKNGEMIIKWGQVKKNMSLLWSKHVDKDIPLPKDIGRRFGDVPHKTHLGRITCHESWAMTDNTDAIILGMIISYSMQWTPAAS